MRLYLKHPISGRKYHYDSAMTIRVYRDIEDASNFYMVIPQTLLDFVLMVVQLNQNSFEGYKLKNNNVWLTVFMKTVLIHILSIFILFIFRVIYFLYFMPIQVVACEAISYFSKFSYRYVEWRLPEIWSRNQGEISCWE